MIRLKWWRHCFQAQRPRGMAMASIERDSLESEPFHDFEWHRQHRGQHSIQLVDVAMCLGWAVLLAWVLFHQS
jgi:hypothetical protein